MWQGDVFEETNISLSLNGDVKVQHKNKQLQSVEKGLIGQTNTEPKNIYKKYIPRNKTDQTKKRKQTKSTRCYWQQIQSQLKSIKQSGIKD